MSAEACAIDPVRSLPPSTNALVGVPAVAELKVIATFWILHARVLLQGAHAQKWSSSHAALDMSRCPPFMTKWWVNFSY